MSDEAEAQLFALNMVDHPETGSTVGIIAKRTYQIHNGSCVVAAEQLSLVNEPQFNEDLSILLHDSDVVLNRKHVDVIVTGKAYGGPAAFDASLRIDKLERRLRVSGDRHCFRSHSGSIRFSEPKPVEAIDLSWSSAYGGADVVTAKRCNDPMEAFCRDSGQAYDPRFGLYAYPRNRAGKGYLVDASDDALEACNLPNLEDPAQLLTPDNLVIGQAEWWPSGPPVAALGWLSYNCFPRAAMVGLPPLFDFSRFTPDTLFEVRQGLLPAASIAQRTPLGQRMSLGAAQQSAVGMRSAELAEGAPVALENLHPAQRAWSFTLPTERPRLMLQMPDERPAELNAQIRTVHIEPDSDRVSIVYVGEHHDPSFVGPGRREKIRCAVKWG